MLLFCNKSRFTSSLIQVAFFVAFMAAPEVMAQDLKSFIDKGDKFYVKGEFKSAMENYVAAEKINPTDPKIKFKIGQTYLSAGEEAKALPWGAVWDYFCVKNNVIPGEAYIAEIQKYEKEVTLKR